VSLFHRGCSREGDATIQHPIHFHLDGAGQKQVGYKDETLNNSLLLFLYQSFKTALIFSMWKTKPQSLDEIYDEHGCFFRVDFCISKLAERVEAEMACCDRIQGTVIKVQDLGKNGGQENEVGTIELLLFKLGAAMNHRIGFFDLMDGEEEDTGRLYKALFDRRTRDFKKEIEAAFFPDEYINRILHIHKLELQSDCRGFGLGKEIAHRAIDTFSEYGTIVTTKPFALQWAGKGTGMSKLKRTEMAKVVNFWRQVGFQCVGKTNFYIYTD
jgi:GNAT superfamily N-acetyltransferase